MNGGSGVFIAGVITVYTNSILAWLEPLGQCREVYLILEKYNAHVVNIARALYSDLTKRRVST